MQERNASPAADAPHREATLELDDLVARFTQASVTGPRPAPGDAEDFVRRYLELRGRALGTGAGAPGLPSGSDSDAALAEIRLDRRRVLGACGMELAPLELPEPRPIERARLARLGGGYPAVAAIARLLARSRPAPVRAVLHGSYATFEAIPYSDLDLLCVYAEDALLSAAGIRAVRHALSQLPPLLAAVDPLSHHGVQVLSEGDLAWHPSPRFPPVLFRMGRSLVLAGRPISLGLVVGDGPDRRRRLERLALSFGDLARAGKVPRDAILVKDLVSRVLLLPALALGTAGEEVWKGDSFAKAEARWPDLDWGIVRTASRWRERWGPVPAAGRLLFPPLAGLLAGRPARLAARAARELARRRTPLPPARSLANFVTAADRFGRMLLAATACCAPR